VVLSNTDYYVCNNDINYNIIDNDDGKGKK